MIKLIFKEEFVDIDNKIIYKETYSNGSVFYMNESSEPHRLGGPAIIYNNINYIAWKKNGKYHNSAGPAVIFGNGDKCWYLEGYIIKCSSQEEFERLIKLKAFW
jgi:hypothetical protein